MSFEVDGNFSIGLPVLSDNNGCSFSSFVDNWLFATRETLLAFLLHVSLLSHGKSRYSTYTAFVLVSSFSIAFEASSLAMAVTFSATGISAFLVVAVLAEEPSGLAVWAGVRGLEA